MASFNELYTSVFGQDGVKSASQKRDKLITHYCSLSRNRLTAATAEWNSKYKSLQQQDQYKALKQQDRELAREFALVTKKLKELEKKVCNIGMQLDEYVYSRIGHEPKDEPDKRLNDELENVARLYRLDRNSQKDVQE